jgi:hypothetical protein
MLWPRAWGIWESSENWTLVKRLRGGYEERRPFEAAPAVLAEPDEIQDLAAFIQVGIDSGWDLELFGVQDMLRAFVSHDGWVEIRSEDTGMLEQLRAELKGADVEILS